jgi:hypothetical protein
VHCQGSVRGVRKVEEFAAWQLADAFKSEVFALLKGSREAMRDRRFRYQLKDSASGPPKHITTATLRLKHSQERYAEQLERERRARSKLKKADKHQVLRTRRTRRTD